jgi:hypothetical protein
MQQLIKTIVVVVLILVAGAVLRSVGVVQDTELWYWSLTDLVEFAMFTAAAVMIGVFAAQLPMQRGAFFFRSAAVAPLLQAVLAALIVWFIYLAANPVLLQDWLGILNAAFAVVMVAIAGYLVWRVYTGFDVMAAELRQARQSAAPATAPPSTPPSPPSAAPTTCPQCGATVAAGKKFCGDCGAELG